MNRNTPFPKESKATLPVVVKQEEALTLPVINAPINVAPDCSDKEAIFADVTYMNAQLQVMHAAWAHVSNVHQACKLALTATSLLKARRELLNKSYGGSIQKQTIDGTLLPID